MPNITTHRLSVTYVIHKHVSDKSFVRHGMTKYNTIEVSRL